MTAPTVPEMGGMRRPASGRPKGPKPMMHATEKSDSPIVPGKPTNKAEQSVAEPVEGRGGAKGNADRQGTRRTQGRARAGHTCHRRRAAYVKPQDANGQAWGKLRFTALLHHASPSCFSIMLLHHASAPCRRRPAPTVVLRAEAPRGGRGGRPDMDGPTWTARRGRPDVDGTTWTNCGRALESNLEDLHDRVHRRAAPRPPVAVAALEDKLVQRAMPVGARGAR